MEPPRNFSIKVKSKRKLSYSKGPKGNGRPEGKHNHPLTHFLSFRFLQLQYQVKPYHPHPHMHWFEIQPPGGAIAVTKVIAVTAVVNMWRRQRRCRSKLVKFNQPPRRIFSDTLVTGMGDAISFVISYNIYDKRL